MHHAAGGLTAEGLLGALISPDARTAYLARSSGLEQAGSLESPGVIERLDLATGDVSEFVRLAGIDDMSVSADGRWLAVAHFLGDAVGHSGISVVDLETGAVTVVPQTADAARALFSSANAVAISPDGTRVAYELAVEQELYDLRRTLRVQELTAADAVVVRTAGRLESFSDMEWAADGSTVIVALTSLSDVRTIRVDGGSLEMQLEGGFARDLTPVSDGGGRLAGVSSSEEEQNTGRGSLMVWDEHGAVRASLPTTPWDLSIAACSYRR